MARLLETRDAKKRMCIGALGASAVLGLPQAFVQPLTSTATTKGHATSSSSVAPRSSGAQRSRANETSTASLSAFGFSMVGATALAANLRSGRKAQTTCKFFGGGSESSYVAFDPANEAGVQDPVGFWDPLGFSDDKDEATFKRRRAVEIKHGRVCMYATIGYMVPEYYKFPGYLSPSQDIRFEDVPNGLGALSKVPLLGWVQILAFAGLIETSGFFSGSSKPIGFMKDSTMDGTPGDYGIGFPNFIGTVDDPEAKKSKLAAELANGRLAMVAIIGMFFQDGLTGSAWGDWSLYTASPLRAFESELGVQAPVGFWDPLGFAKDGDEASFKRRRSVEIKHGRICMMATMGYITPEITGKFPGYLSPSAELKFADIPNGLAAISKVPGAGWAQIVAYFGFCEFSGGFDDYKTGTPGDYGWKALTASEPEEKTKKLAAEIANGRLAMVAIIGMFFQDGLTGEAWGDWSLYADSPLRARSLRTARQFFGGGGGSTYVAFDPANEAGVQDPVGFWDPLGFSDDKDEATFKRRRAVEIKHGRVCMYATIGYMVPEYYKFPGYLSPSQELKFEDVPNGLGALSKVPLAGWLQILFFAGIIETSGFFSGSSQPIGFMKDSTQDGEPGDYGVGFPNFIGRVEDPEAKKSKLAAELANGRLAMVAIIGMFFQDGLTGSAWGDWALYTASPLRHAARDC